MFVSIYSLYGFVILIMDGCAGLYGLFSENVDKLLINCEQIVKKQVDIDEFIE